MLKRVARVGDLWEGMLRERFSLTEPARRLKALNKA